MVFPYDNTPPRSSKKAYLLKPCLTSTDGSEAPQNLSLSVPSPPENKKPQPLSVTFIGWRFADKKFTSWAREMAALHAPIWRKAGIFEAVVASTYKIHRDTDLVLGIAEKWCPETRTFVFSWGETTITLEDVMVLLGFSVLGSPVFATLDSSGENIMAKLKKEWRKMKEKVRIITQVVWMERFRDSGDELEHVAFLACWLSYYVFPASYYNIYKAMFPIAVHLSIGTRIALGPAVLANLYAELSLLKNSIRAFGGSTIVVKPANLNALFKLVQVWTWERFKELQPKPNPLSKGEPRLALWHDLKKKKRDATSDATSDATIDPWQILDNSKLDSIEWRPYTNTVKDWEFPKFYPEKQMWVPVSHSLDDEFISFARFIKVSRLVGIKNVEHYFPDRVASQFGMLQGVPSAFNQDNVSRKVAWNNYNQPIGDLTLYIPSRTEIPCVTPRFCEWLRNSSPVVESAETFKGILLICDGSSSVPTGSTLNRTSKDKMKKAEVVNKRLKYMKRARENNESIEETGRKAGKRVVSPPETKQTSGGELVVYGSNAEKRTMIDGGSKEADCLVHGDSVIAGEQASSVEKLCRSEARKEADVGDDDSLIPRKIARNEPALLAEKNEPSPRHKGASGAANGGETNKASKSKVLNPSVVSNIHIAVGVLNPSAESNIHIAVGEGSRGQDCLLPDNGLVSMKSNEQLGDLEKRNNDVGEGDADNGSNEKRFHDLKALVSSVGERINEVGKKLAWLKERRARKLAAAGLI